MAFSANLGYPRFGPNRELKRILEDHWSGKIDADTFRDGCGDIRLQNWLTQQAAGIQHIPGNDFSMYDHVLDTAVRVGAIPERYNWSGGTVNLETYFAMARGIQNEKQNVQAMEMTKWFDTNYHYIVPEFTRDQSFQLNATHIINQIHESKIHNINIVPVILGPVSFLLLGKPLDDSFDVLDHLENLTRIYIDLIHELEAAGMNWVQFDEPFLVTDLSRKAQIAFRTVYTKLGRIYPHLKIKLATYFGGLDDNLEIAASLPVDALHIDLIRAPNQLQPVLAQIPETMMLSLGVVNGRNIWKTDLSRTYNNFVQPAREKLGEDRLIIAPSCSLMFSPVDLQMEEELDADLSRWLAFSKQKLDEISVLTEAVNNGPDTVRDQFQKNASDIESRQKSEKIHKNKIRSRLQSVDQNMLSRQSEHSQRKRIQQERLQLPVLPTTTIGSYPQTSEIRKARNAWRKGELSDSDYNNKLKDEIRKTIEFQEKIDLDVLVHGEPERSDMVEYFAQQLEGIAFTNHGWVQSYGSRGVRPPIIYGDIDRPEYMTVDWIRFAQSLTEKPVKAMLTGPVTILQWSFVRDDQPLANTCRQLAMSIRDEVQDLEEAGIQVIQIDEPALREGLPLRESQWEDYLNWAVESFRLAASGVKDETQIHTHMCYADFNDIIESIGNMDADVISIESYRSKMELLDAFDAYDYPNDIGPGVYDIHSPRVPDKAEMVELIRKAISTLDRDQVWVNPDCGLKTRNWDEVKPSLKNMVDAAKEVRESIQ